MNHFFVFNGRRIKKAFFLTMAAMLSVAVIWVEKNNLSVFAPHPPSAVYNVPTDRKVIALTFDISWGEKRAEPILEVLKAKNVENVTFFLSAPWSKAHPDLVKKNRGCRLRNRQPRSQARQLQSIQRRGNPQADHDCGRHSKGYDRQIPVVDPIAQRGFRQARAPHRGRA